MSSCSRMGWMAGTGLALAILAGVPAHAEGPPAREPHIGYVYPAGGQQGTVFRVTVGGQFLQGASEVHVSGTGVTATVARYVKPLTKKQEGDVRKNMSYLQQQERARKAGKTPPAPPDDLPALPDHPWLEGVRDMDGPALQELRMKLFNPKKQPNTQIAETVELEVTVAPDAVPGDRELRLGTALGLTNPMCMQVGELPEVVEPEPGAPPPVLEFPVLVNGQILPGETDRFRFRAREGQRVQVEARARHLIPYLADAVPGWFQSMLTLYDANGQQLACADDNQFEPDPCLRATLPADGEYELEIRDAIYRGRQDFVYRMTVREIPVSADEPVADAGPVNDIRREQEPNNTPAEAEPVTIPQWVAGCLDYDGDVDQFALQGHTGDALVVEAFARRRLHSPVDALIKLMDDSGKTVAWNDDYMEKDGHLHLGPGLITHHADAYLQARLPKDGTYYVTMEDAQRHGGEDCTYQLRMAPPQPDFALRVTPSSLTIPTGRALPVEVYALRRDGFDGAIHLALVDAPPGFVLDGARIPPGVNHIRVTLTAPRQAGATPVALQLEGRAHIGEQEIRHAAEPADNTMQAFLWRHLLPAQEFLVSVRQAKGVPESFTRTGEGPLSIAPGSEATIHLRVPDRPALKAIQWELLDPPAGLSLGKAKVGGGELVISVRAAAEGLVVGTCDNLIIGATLSRPTTKGRRRNQATFLGVLPAIPVEIVNATEG